MQGSSAATGIDGDQAGDSAPRAGAVYVFARDAGTWHQQAYVKASNTDAEDRFGAGLALSGDGATLVAGAPSESSAAPGVCGDQADDSLRASGAVYSFEFGTDAARDAAVLPRGHLRELPLQRR